MRPKLVTIASFNTPGEANIARNYLDAAGVQAFLPDESAATMAWHLSGAIGGIKLQVADRDVAKAQAFLRADRGELPADDSDDLHHDATDIPPSPVQRSSDCFSYRCNFILSGYSAESAFITPNPQGIAAGAFCLSSCWTCR